MRIQGNTESDIHSKWYDGWLIDGWLIVIENLKWWCEGRSTELTRKTKLSNLRPRREVGQTILYWRWSSCEQYKGFILMTTLHCYSRPQLVEAEHLIASLIERNNWKIWNCVCYALVCQSFKYELWICIEMASIRSLFDP